LKICLITPFYDPWLLGGAEKYAKTLVEELSTIHEFVVITSKGPIPRKQQNLSHSSYKIIEITPRNILTLYDVTKKDLTLGFKKYLWHFFDLWNISAYIKIKNILKEEKPNLVHINGIMGFSPSVFSLLKDLQIPHVLTIHDLSLISRWSSLFRKGKPVF